MAPELTAEQREQVTHVDGMSQLELCRRWRFAETGDPLLQGAVGAHFKQRLDQLGGFTPAISKALGW